MKTGKILAAAFALMLAGGAVYTPEFGFADIGTVASAADITASGECGEKAVWSIDDEGQATISGTGAVMDYLTYDPPFHTMPNLKSLNVEDGITRIGAYSLSGCIKLEAITLAPTVSSIGQAAFLDNPELRSIIILSPDCEIFDAAETISNGKGIDGKYYFDGTIYGYEGSTAQAYAEKYNKRFEVIEDKPAKVVSYGDPTGDNKIDSNDATFVLVEYAKTATGEVSTLSEEQKYAADANKDAKIDSKDASAILSYYSYCSTGGKDSLEDFLFPKEK